MKRIKFILIAIALACIWIIPRGVAAQPFLPASGGTGVSGMGSSCHYPTGEKARECQEIEKAILDSTVRIEFFWDELDGSGNVTRTIREVSHGTIKNGRFLVTHNHFLHTLLKDMSGNQKNILFSLYTAMGETILADLPLSALAVRMAETETLVLDLGQYKSNDIGPSITGGLFELMSLPSAQFKAFSPAALKVGDEVAQVQWDGAHTVVQWVQIEAIENENVPTLRLASLPQHGSSGGGVFWNGYHIGNTLSYTYEYNQLDGKMVGSYSTVVLNSPAVATVR